MTKGQAVWISFITVVIGFSTFIYFNRDSYFDKQETIEEPTKETPIPPVHFSGEIGDTHFKIVEIDSCEYLISGVGPKRIFAHKGNCKYCIDRNKRLYGVY